MTNNELYLDWVNNFLTVSFFAEYYGMDEDQARWIIESERNKARNL